MLRAQRLANGFFEFIPPTHRNRIINHIIIYILTKVFNPILYCGFCRKMQTVIKKRLLFLASFAEIHSTAHIGGFPDKRSATHTGFSVGVFTELGNIAAGISEYIVFRVPSALFTHFFKDSHNRFIHILIVQISAVSSSNISASWCFFG